MLSSFGIANIASKYRDGVVFDQDKLKAWRKPWKKCLIGKFLAMMPPIHVLRDQVARTWKHVPQILDMENGIFLFKFQSIDDVVEILIDGP